MIGEAPEEMLDGADGMAVVEMSEEDLAALKAEMEAEKERAAQERDSFLEGLGVSLAANRSAAIAARESSGIEQEWQEDEEHYEGIDDVNRGDRNSWRGKPPGAPTVKEQSTAASSTVFVNITAPYVDAAAATFCDMVMATDDRAWSLAPTPIPDLGVMEKGQIPSRLIQQANQQFPNQPEVAQQQLKAAINQALLQMQEARKRAEAAQKQIEDWHVECQFHAEVRQVIEDTAKIGTGILKGPVPVKKKTSAFENGALVIKEEIKPASYRIDAWNFYPDPACGENIHNGSETWERDDITDRGLLALKGAPGYLDDQIDKVLEEGALKATRIAPDRPVPDGQTPDKKGMYEIWYHYGRLKRDQLEALGYDAPEGEHISVPVEVTMVNNRVIRAELNLLDTGDFPYDIMTWQKRTGRWTGIGVSRKVRTPQEIVTGAARNMMDNAGRAGGPQLVLTQGVVEPHDGVYEVTPWKIWLAKADAEQAAVDKAFRFVTIPMLQQELTNIIQLGLKLAEDATGLPLLLQGQRSDAKETLGGMQLRNNNATAGIRRIARTLDDKVTEPHIRRYYTYLMQYGPEECKGDYQIDARGSTALVQRDVENQSIGEMANMVLNPVFGIDPKKWAQEWLKARHLSPERFEYDDEQWKQIVENMQKGPQDPRMQIAQLNMQLRQAEMQMEQQEAQADRQLKLMIAQMDAKLAEAGLTADQQKVLSEVRARIDTELMRSKSKLADTAIKIRGQREMQMQDHAVQISTPPIEPAGRAAPGKAYIQ